MRIRERWQMLLKRLLRRHGDVKSFDHEVQALGGSAGSRHIGLQVVPTAKVVGSVGLWRNLRSDFFYKQGQAMTERFVRIGSAMRQGKPLPPLELYKVKARRPGGKKNEPAEMTEYYVVDGHHRVAMARKLGQDFLDARIVEFQVGNTSETTLPPPDHTGDSTAAHPGVEQSDAPAIDSPDPSKGSMRGDSSRPDA